MTIESGCIARIRQASRDFQDCVGRTVVVLGQTDDGKWLIDFMDERPESVRTTTSVFTIAGDKLTPIEVTA